MVVRPCEERRDEAAVVGVVRRHEEEDERVRHGGEEAADDSDGDRTIKVVIGYGRADAEGGNDVDLRPHAVGRTKDDDHQDAHQHGSERLAVVLRLPRIEGDFVEHDRRGGSMPRRTRRGSPSPLRPRVA